MVGAYSQFPHSRFKAAQEYLYALKPWWRRFGESIRWVPISVPPPPGHDYGAVTESKPNLVVFIDSGFAASAPLHVVAGAVERELQKLVRKTYARLTYVPESKSIQRNVAFELEINSTIAQEAEQNDISVLGIEYVHKILSTSYGFTNDDYQRWGVTDYPNIDKHAFLPSQFGFPEGLSAEDYFRLIENPEPEEEEGLQDGDNSQSGSGEQNDESEPDQGSEQQSGESGEQEQQEGQDDPQSGEEDVSESGQQESVSDGSVTSEESEPESESGSSTGGNSSSDERGESQSETEQGDQQETEGRPSDHNETSQDDSQQDSNMTQSPSEMIEEMMMDDPAIDWLARDHDLDEPDDLEELNEYQIDDALEEAADDICEADGSIGFGLKPGNGSVEWTQIHIRKRVKSWQGQLMSLMSASITSAKMQGSADFSYSVRNPNQPKFGPVLMGVHDYAPTVYIVLDTSGSMQSSMSRALSSFRDIVKTVSGKYGVPVTWITIDNTVRDVGTTLNLDDTLVQRVTRSGFGGTRLKDTLSDLAKGKFQWERKRYQKPDMIVILTDCGFMWPWTAKRPSGTKVIVASTQPIEFVKSERIMRLDFPRWITEKSGNFIYIPK